MDNTVEIYETEKELREKRLAAYAEAIQKKVQRDSEQIIKENSFAEKCIALIPIRIATIATYSYGGARLGYFFAIPEMYLISMILICIMRKSKSKIGVWLSKMFVVVFVAQEYIRFIKNLVEASGVVPYLLG